MVYKIIGTFVIIAAATLAYLTFKGDNSADRCVQLSPAQQLSQMIDRDFQNLSKEGQLPEAWRSIATIEYKVSSQLASAILGQERPHIQRFQEGKNFLEVEVLDLPDENDPGIIIQASLFDIKSKNKIFEIGRTYTMNDLNGVKKAEELAPAKNENSKTKKIETH
jgi:hypothetical protein